MSSSALLFSYARWDTLVARRSLHTEEALLAIRNELEIARRIQTFHPAGRHARNLWAARGCAVCPHVPGGGRFLRFSGVDPQNRPSLGSSSTTTSSSMSCLWQSRPPCAEVNHPNAQAAGAASTSSRFFGTFGTTEVLNSRASRVFQHFAQ